MKNRVFQFVVFSNPEEGKGEIITSGFVLAATEEKARTQVAVSLSKEQLKKVDELEIVVRPF